ncbi:hypothetical protein SRB17_52790 [Streptomyces sp. RB17]|nr:hypothetical protein [Streptomyces sp. RB17]
MPPLRVAGRRHARHEGHTLRTGWFRGVPRIGAVLQPSTPARDRATARARDSARTRLPAPVTPPGAPAHHALAARGPGRRESASARCDLVRSSVGGPCRASVCRALAVRGPGRRESASARCDLVRSSVGGPCRAPVCRALAARDPGRRDWAFGCCGLVRSSVDGPCRVPVRPGRAARSVGRRGCAPACRAPVGRSASGGLLRGPIPVGRVVPGNDSRGRGTRRCATGHRRPRRRDRGDRPCPQSLRRGTGRRARRILIRARTATARRTRRPPRPAGHGCPAR